VRARPAFILWGACLGLELDGAGAAWFDDVELKRIGDLPKAP
jgi:hypothetical protein